VAYAADTSVPVVKSRLDIEGLLQRNGATQYLTAHDHEAGRAIVQFKLAERLVRFTVTIPPITGASIARQSNGSSAGIRATAPIVPFRDDRQLDLFLSQPQIGGDS
jgi:hypothetical protein